MYLDCVGMGKWEYGMSLLLWISSLPTGLSTTGKVNTERFIRESQQRGVSNLNVVPKGEWGDLMSFS